VAEYKVVISQAPY